MTNALIRILDAQTRIRSYYFSSHDISNFTRKLSWFSDWVSVNYIRFEQKLMLATFPISLQTRVYLSSWQVFELHTTQGIKFWCMQNNIYYYFREYGYLHINTNHTDLIFSQHISDDLWTNKFYKITYNSIFIFILLV